MLPATTLKHLASFCKWQARLTLTFLLGTARYFFPDLTRYKRTVREKSRKLMIIAHPDDDALFFSRLLMSDEKDLTVFCLTNGYDPIRRKEFYRAMTHYGVHGYIMKLPDKTALSFLFNNGSVSGRIKDLSRKYSSCDTVYTHNPEGEYGHRHHRLIGQNVARHFPHARIIVPAPCRRIGDAAYLLTERQLSDKEYVFETFYATQAKGVKESLPAWFYHEKLSCLSASGQHDERLTRRGAGNAEVRYSDNNERL